MADVPTMTDWLQTAAAFGGVAIAGYALYYAKKQVSSSFEASREAVAQEAFRDYLALCIEYPDLTSSVAFLTKSKKRKAFKDILMDASEESEEYLWFVTNLLNTGEQILESVSAAGEWSKAIELQVSYHRPLLLEVWRKRLNGIAWEETYGADMQRLVDGMLARGGSKVGG